MRYRLRWGKRGRLRYLSHHDEALVFERSARRAELPLAYSQGFSPHPKIAFGSGLPVGYSSEVELMDIELTESLEPSEVPQIFNTGLPEGLEILEAAPRVPGSKSLGAVIAAAEYDVEVQAPWLAAGLEEMLERKSFEIIRPHKGGVRKDDLRVGLLDAHLTARGVWLRTSIQPRSIRPSDVIAAIAEIVGAEGPRLRVHRVALLSGAGDRIDATSGSEVAA